MPTCRRYYVPGATYFFTVVTHSRAPILCAEHSRRFLHESIEECRAQRPFRLLATVLLSDHLHAIWCMPDGDDNYSTRWALIKKGFTERYLDAGYGERAVTASHRHLRRRGVW